MAEQLPETLLKFAQFLDDRKAENITVLDLRDVANIADFFVVATAANAPHLKALGDGLQRLCKNEHYRESRHAGSGESGWVIADYDGIMVHVFSFEMRELYDLEKLWKDAKRIEL
jgi:ribosome-associated protein